MLNRKVVAVALLFFATKGAAFGESKTFNKSVKSGVLTELHYYSSWHRESCELNGGVVRLLSRPQHGRVLPQKTLRMFREPIRRDQVKGPCWGRSYLAFVISYRSEPGFRGIDTFSVQVTLGNGSSYIDYYNLNVN
jgi:hypothetical protein